MSSRRKSRESALQMLFQSEVNQYPHQVISEIYWQLYPDSGENRNFAQFLLTRCLQNLDQVDSWIRRHAEHWRLERMAQVDRNVLRLAVTELLFADTPEAVVIDEAIEIARRFSTEDSAEFVNGILDSVVREMQSAEAAQPK